MCINKNKPELQCNGKCHLANQIKQQEEKENQNTSSEATTKTEIIFIHNVKTELPVRNIVSTNNTSITEYNRIFNSSDFLDRLLRPPQLS